MSSSPATPDWTTEFSIDSGVVFLNHASFGPVTNRGRRAVESLMARWGQFAEGPDVDRESYAKLAQARRDFAAITGGDRSRVAFVSNASFGLNTVLWGMNLRRGERLLVPEVEFPAIVYAARHIAHQRGLNLDVLPCPDGYFTSEDLERALRKKTAALVFSWVQYFNGYRYDLDAIAEICHRHGCFTLVDGTQGVGAVPMNVRKAGIDALACGAQKWLFGQPGSGFLYIAREPIRPVQPLYAGWLGVDWSHRFHDLRRWDRPPCKDGRQWEIGTYPYFALRFAQAGLELLLECGIPEIWRRIHRLHRQLSAGLDGTRYNAQMFPQKNASGIITIQGPRIRKLQTALTARRIYTSLREGRVRVSPHFYNTSDNIDRLLTAIREFDRS
ncbi:MAG: aminotransferase class V-fold PLP-dependent enzyme [Candidatus Zixiibacteriota bacterium]